MAQLERQGVFARRVQVDVAAHSPQVQPLLAELEAKLIGIRPRALSVPMYSTVHHKQLEGPELDAAYWAANLRQRVEFSNAVQQLVSDGHTTFLELSPHPTLLPALMELVQTGGGVVLPSLRRDQAGPFMLRETLAALYANRQPIAWDALYPSGTCAELPTYPWQRERFWLDSTTSAPTRRPRAGAHPLLGEHLELASPPGTHAWLGVLSPGAITTFSEHRVDGLALMPAAGFLEMALAGATEIFGSGAYLVEQVRFEQPLVLPASAAPSIQLILEPESRDGIPWKIASRAVETARSGGWTVNATGVLQRGVSAESDGSPTTASDMAAIERRCGQHMTGSVFYAGLADAGLDYGPPFQRIQELWVGDGEALARVRVPTESGAGRSAYLIHPAVLDACFQTLGATVRGAEDGNGVWLPVALERLRVLSKPEGDVRVHAVAHPADEGTISADIRAFDTSGRVLIEALGLRAVRSGARDSIDDWLYELDWRAEPLADGTNDTSLTGRWLVFGDAADELTGSTVDELVSRGAEVIPAHAYDFRSILQDANAQAASPLRGIVYVGASPPTAAASAGAGSTEQPAELSLEEIDRAQTRGSVGALELVQAIAAQGWRDAPRLWLVTRGAQAVVPGEQVLPEQAPLWGLGRSLALEYPELNCTLLDVPTSTPVPALVDELASSGLENQVAWRDTTRFVARLVRAKPEPQASPHRPMVRAGRRSFHLEQSAPGTLAGLVLREAERRLPGPGEVELEVAVAGLNFLDVLGALGALPAGAGPPAPGGECAGRVSAVGEDVTEFQVGDPVLALAPASFGRYVVTSASVVAHRPATMSPEEAATLPVAFLTAAYSLDVLGRLSAGERVLIHSASGGTGLAAVQIAQRRGAQVFATAGSLEKRAYLRTLGIEHVYDSRSPGFGEQVRQATGGRGVDVVLNSLTGEFIQEGLNALAAYGRFVEIGKRDIYLNRPLGLAPFRRNLAYFGFDLARLVTDRPGVVGSLLRELIRDAVAGELRPLPYSVFSLAESSAAFRQMAQARHIGKIVLSLADAEQLPIAAASGWKVRRDG
ncbi:MAG TPA: polyketide synthase dehydratase domain-containing protein, partial [Chloroflexota bacterium]